MVVSPDSRVLALAWIQNPWERNVINLLSMALPTGDVEMGEGLSPRYSYQTTEGVNVSLELIRQGGDRGLLIVEERSEQTVPYLYSPLEEILSIDPVLGIVGFVGPDFYVEVRPQGVFHPQNE